MPNCNRSLHRVADLLKCKLSKNVHCSDETITIIQMEHV